MQDRLLKFPEPLIRDVPSADGKTTVRAYLGLAEYLLQNVLNAPAALASVALLEFTMWLAPQLLKLTGAAQLGRQIVLTHKQWEMLCKLSERQESCSFELVPTVAGCLLAVQNAPVVPEKKKEEQPALAQPVEVALPVEGLSS